MLGLDEQITALGDGGLATALLVAFLLGLRHATDADHLTAVSALTLSESPGGGRRTSLLGLYWGLGHGVTLVALGLPVVLFRHRLPEGVGQAAEILVGAVIVLLAIRIIVRWRRGYFHSHPHRHGSVRHSHPHAHARDTAHDRHAHPHGETLGRSPRTAFGIGLLHGAGGSAAVSVLLVSAASGRVAGVTLLCVFAAATAASMASASALLGYLLSRPGAVRGRIVVMPAFAGASLVFGLSYGLGALWG